MTPSVTMQGSNTRTGRCAQCKRIAPVLDWELTLVCPCANCQSKTDTVSQTRCGDCILAFMDKAHAHFPDAVIRFRINDKEVLYDPSQGP